MTADAHAALAAAMRRSRGRLVALLAARTRDLAAAEDALAESAGRALETWPTQGVPNQPEAWLLAVARRRLLDGWRHARVHAAFATDHLLRHDEHADEPAPGADWPDERLPLLFVCAHPALDQTLHAPLMLQVVMGVSAERLAGRFLVRPAALGQCLARAKAKIRDAGIAFRVPAYDELPQRLPAVLDAIHAAYGVGWDAAPDASAGHADLADEALSLARLLAAWLPTPPEALGLLALLLFCESRRDARRGPDGRYVPLDEQDTRRWNHAQMDAAAEALACAARAGEIGRYQLEAAIQSVHAQRALSGRTDWAALDTLYQGLIARVPALGYRLGWISVLARRAGAQPAFEQLALLDAESLRDHQPYWALRAHLLQALGRDTEARQAFARAIELTDDDAVRCFLRHRADSTPIRAE